MLTVDIALPDVEELQKLVASGQEKGFLTYDEIVKGIEEVELSKEQVEDFTTYLIDHGVELVEGEEHKRLPHEQPLVEEEVKAAPKLEGYGVTLVDDHTLEVEVSKEQNLNDIFTRLSGLGVEVLSMRNKVNRLEEIFMRLMEARGEKAAAALQGVAS